VGKPKGKRPIGSLRLRWVNNIKMDTKEAACGVMDWIDLVQEMNRWWTHVNAVTNLRVPYIAGTFLTS
jgi:hypothetical protein